MKRVLCSTIAMLLMLALTACTTSEVSTDLDVAAAAVNTLATTIPAIAGLDAATSQQLANYASCGASGLTNIATEMDQGALTPTEITQSVANLASCIAPNLPAGTNPILLSALAAAKGDVQALLSILQGILPMASKPGGSVAQWQVRISWSDKRHVHSALNHLKKAQKTIQALPR